uniref:Tetraspanin n=1 Tax=Romanomermis culicivorax TaxID=13658 RepID=A0A915HTT4_ROMCU
MVQHYYQGAGIVQEVLDSLQSVFRCCGNAGCGDFIALRLVLPRTCDLDCYGCRERIFRFLRDGMTVVSVFGSFMLIAELLSVVISAYLLCKLKEKITSQNPATVYEMTYQPQKSQLVARKLRVSNTFGSGNDDRKVVYLSYPVHSQPSKGKDFCQ